jgi:hypothetical protein
MREGRYNRKILQSQLTELLQAYDGGWGAAEASPGYLSVCWLFIFKVTEPNSILLPTGESGPSDEEVQFS